ncbi:DUF6090 family protein [Flaviramulus multivorans]|uniref:DUF6090 family protein n=1 Tax=Flaviramulus multivorans TaxID=1304750 RepID=UPI0021D447EB|nr:DUF6090 family protein [Flaviramulus multivorans]
MIKFFRKIRQGLLSKNKFSKYLLYAIGEIILVVIGILIALSINNWNEERKAAEYTKLLFKNTLEELKFNIEKANAKVAYFRSQNSAYYVIINKKATRQNFKINGLAYLLFSGYEVELSDNTFQKLLSSHEKLTQEQDDLLSKLKLVYNNYKGEVDFLDTKIVDFIFDLHKKYKDEQSWYPNFISNSSISDDMIDYFLNDPEYINDASYFYSLGAAQQNSSVKRFRDNAIITYTELSNHLNITPDTAIVKDLTNYRHYLGTYKRDNLTLYIKEEAEGLIQTIIANEDTDNSTTVKNSILYLDSKSYFTDRNNFGKLIYDNDNNVTKIEYTRGAQKYNFEKSNKDL